MMELVLLLFIVSVVLVIVLSNGGCDGVVLLVRVLWLKCGVGEF